MFEKLFEKLKSDSFKDAANGDLFYNFYVYPYDAEKEYEAREQIMAFKESLVRPNDYVDVLCIDIFKEFCDFLNEKNFGPNPSMLKYLIDKDNQDSDDAHAAVTEALTANATSEAFYMRIRDKIEEHIALSDDKQRPYVFVYGVGQMFPYLHTSTFLSGFEKYNKSSKYRVIVFYPGSTSRNDFQLFGKLNEHHTYRATLLNPE